MKAAFLGVAIGCFVLGLVFVLLPGPAILFFALGGALLGTQFLWVARVLDTTENWGRKTLDSTRTWWQRRGKGDRR